MWNVMYNVIISIVTISMLFSSIFADDAPICILFASPMCDGWRLTEEAMSVMVCPAQASLVHHFLCWHFLSSIITCNYVILCRIAWTFDIYIYMYVYTLWHGSRIHPRSSSRCSVSSFVFGPPGSRFGKRLLLRQSSGGSWGDGSSDWSLPEYPAW